MKRIQIVPQGWQKSGTRKLIQENRQLRENVVTLKQDIDTICNVFDKQLKEYEEKLSEAKVQLPKPEAQKAEKSPYTFTVTEEEFFEDEIMSYVLDSLEEYAQTLPNGRRLDVLQNILANNRPKVDFSKRKKLLKETVRGFRHMTSQIKSRLKQLGFDITVTSNHIKVHYYGDSRYMTILPASGSDRRAGDNIASILNQLTN